MSKLNNAIILALAILGGLFLVLVVFFAITDSQDAPTPQEARQQFQPVDKLSGVERQSFLRYCNVDGDIQAYCECTLKYLEDRMTATQIRQLDSQVTVDNMPEVMWEAVDACAPLILNEGNI